MLPSFGDSFNFLRATHLKTLWGTTHLRGTLGRIIWNFAQVICLLIKLERSVCVGGSGSGVDANNKFVAIYVPHRSDISPFNTKNGEHSCTLRPLIANEFSLDLLHHTAAAYHWQNLQREQHHGANNTHSPSKKSLHILALCHYTICVILCSRSPTRTAMSSTKSSLYR